MSSRDNSWLAPDISIECPSPKALQCQKSRRYWLWFWVGHIPWCEPKPCAAPATPLFMAFLLSSCGRQGSLNKSHTATKLMLKEMVNILEQDTLQ